MGNQGVIVGGDDILNGDAGDDTLFGDTSSFRRTLTAGSDTLNGGVGNDTLYGDAGEFAGTTGTVSVGATDAFVFDTATDFGNDVIKDAYAGTATPAEDIVKFTGVLDGAGTDFADLDAIATFTDNGSGSSVVVTIGTNSVTIEGVGTGAIGSTAALDATAQVAVVVAH